ncbi:DDE-type integrase/transposase/recombinase [uncultured Jatrophihabitans sp.]|uniref:DDE-type integrase/transposase/recombinase n=1 Tax=uncultured Jatrophihabitans sp. TaxID=1610747 RepID=UPI0035CA27FA
MSPHPGGPSTSVPSASAAADAHLHDGPPQTASHAHRIDTVSTRPPAIVSLNCPGFDAASHLAKDADTTQLACRGLEAHGRPADAPRGMRGLTRGRKIRTTIPGKDGVRAGDLLNRDFRTTAPNRAWVTDFTYVATWSGFAYVAFAIDLYSRAIVGWSTAATKDVAFVESCLSMALWRRDHTGRPMPDGMIHHSDAGYQGGFNWSSQHLVIVEVFGGSSTASSRSCGTSEVEVAWSSEVPASCRGRVLGRDRQGPAGRGSCWRDRRGAGSRSAVVPQRWRYAAIGPAAEAFGPISVLRRTRGHRAAARSRQGRA